MKFLAPLSILALVMVGDAAAATPGQNAPKSAHVSADGFWAHAHWDDDREDQRRYGPMPRPDETALRALGVVRVLDVERDDGRMEVEGLDARGREIDVLMDITGRRVLASRIDRDALDRWED